MRTILLITLLGTASLILPCIHAQRSERDRKTFADTKAKAEKGDAEAQFNLGVCYHDGQGAQQVAAVQKRVKELWAEIEAKP